jgi:hypothetical protein
MVAGYGVHEKYCQEVHVRFIPVSEAYKHLINLNASEGNFFQKNPSGVLKKFLFTFFEEPHIFAAGKKRRYARVEVST